MQAGHSSNYHVLPPLPPELLLWPAGHGTRPLRSRLMIRAAAGCLCRIRLLLPGMLRSAAM